LMLVGMDCIEVCINNCAQGLVRLYRERKKSWCGA
jgi:hypothetical protein